jgi:signal transduction histidine kinase
MAVTAPAEGAGTIAGGAAERRMRRPTRSRGWLIARDLLSTLPPFIAFIIEWRLWFFLKPNVWFMFYPAVLVSAWIGGLRAAIFASGLSTALVLWLLVPLQGAGVQPGNYVAAGVFFATGVGIGLVVERLKHTTRSVERSYGELHAAAAQIDALYEEAAASRTCLEHDIADRKRREADAKLLAEAAAALASSLDYRETLATVARLAVANMADFCVVDIVEDDGELRRVQVAARNPANAWICDALMRAPIDGNRPHLARPVLRSQCPILMQECPPDLADWLALTEEHRAALRAMTIRSLIAVPLLGRERLLGALVFVSTGVHRVYDARDLELAQSIAGRAAISIENARLYRAAREAVRARDRVLAVVAHDLRNPLGNVLMQTALLREQTEASTEWDRTPSGRIERAATRMNRLIQDLLDAARIEEGHMQIQRACVAPQALLSEAVEGQRPLSAAHHVDIRVEAPIDLPEVVADRDRILQVFENLLGNALKFVGQGGRIVVGAECCGGAVRFHVSDDGPGIPPEQIPHLFDRFSTSCQKPAGGVGLGLSIAKGIVESHGGCIWVESELDRGSTFYFSIPVVTTTPQPIPSISQKR